MHHNNIIFDCERMKYPYSGLYFFCKNLGRALLQQQLPSALSFYLPEGEKGVFGKEVPYIAYQSYHKFFPNYLSRCSIWHSTYQASNYIPLKKNNLKIVATIHDLNFLHVNKSSDKEKKYLKKIQSTLDKADHIITISHFVKQELLQYLDTGGKPVDVIYNGRNIPPPAPFCKPNGTFDKPFFFTVGTITDKKNFHVLPALLLQNDYELIISGITQNEAYKQKIIQEAKKLRVEKRVKFTGPVSELEKYWLLTNCAAFAFPSLAEGFGLPVIEAMQLGTPVLLSEYTSLPEIGGPHALFFKDLSEEGVSQLAREFLNRIDTQEKRQELILWAKQFDWNEAASNYAQIYNSLLVQN